MNRMTTMSRDARICVAGAGGLVGGALARALTAAGHTQVVALGRAQADLTDQAATRAWFDRHRPEYVFVAAARVGGIAANDSYPADFIRDNLAIELNVIDAAYRAGARKLLFLGSSCIYPKHAPQPMREEHLLTGPLEPTNQWYAVAKIAGIKLCQAYRRQYGFDAICPMPTNLYGPGDNFDPENSHVLPALMRKFHEAHLAGAPEVTVWGSGTPRREFLHVDDLADACVFLMHHYSDEQIINVGVGQDVTIAELAALIGQTVGYRGRVVYDASRPDGTPRKLLDVSRLTALGWTARIGLADGIRATYAWYCRDLSVGRSGAAAGA